MLGERQNYITTLSMGTITGVSGLHEYLKEGKKGKWLDTFDIVAVQLGIKEGDADFPPWPSLEKIFSYKPNRERIKGYVQKALEVTEKVKRNEAPYEEVKEVVKEGEDIIKFLEDFKREELF